MHDVSLVEWGADSVDPFSLVLTTLAHTAIRALIEGETPTAAAWAQATTAVLEALLAERPTTSATLERIEAKIDALRRSQFDHPFQAGLHFLVEAQPRWRKQEDRERALSEARSRFVDAATAATDDLAALVSYWYLALTWLLLRSPQDCLLYLARAADQGYEALVQGATYASNPPLDAVKERAERAGPRASFLDRLLLLDSSEVDARWTIRREALAYLRQARLLLLGIQRTRRRLGVSPPASPVPRVSPLPDLVHAGEDRAPGVEVLVDLTPGVPTQIGSLTICMHRAAMEEGAPSFHRVDCELAFELAPHAPRHVWMIALLDAPNAKVLKTQAGGVYYVPRPARFLAQSTIHAALEKASTPARLPGRSILASGKAYAPDGRLALDGGTHARGWLRLVSWGRPLAVEIRGASTPLMQPSHGPFTMQPRFIMLAPIGDIAGAPRSA